MSPPGTADRTDGSGYMTGNARNQELVERLRGINEAFSRNNMLGTSAHRRALAQAELDSLKSQNSAGNYGVFYR